MSGCEQEWNPGKLFLLILSLFLVPVPKGSTGLCSVPGRFWVLLVVLVSLICQLTLQLNPPHKQQIHCWHKTRNNVPYSPKPVMQVGKSNAQLRYQRMNSSSAWIIQRTIDSVPTLCSSGATPFLHISCCQVPVQTPGLVFGCAALWQPWDSQWETWVQHPAPSLGSAGALPHPPSPEASLHRPPVSEEILLGGGNILVFPHFQCLVIRFRGSSVPGAGGCSGTDVLGF